MAWHRRAKNYQYIIYIYIFRFRELSIQETKGHAKSYTIPDTVGQTDLTRPTLKPRPPLHRKGVRLNLCLTLCHCTTVWKISSTGSQGYLARDPDDISHRGQRNTKCWKLNVFCVVVRRGGNWSHSGQR